MKRFALLVRERLRNFAIRSRVKWLTMLWGHRIAPTARISFSAYLDRTYPEGIVIGEKSILTRGAVILNHDFSRSYRAETCVGRNCFIGVNAIVMPGICIGDEVVVGAGAVVTTDIPSGSLVVGNPGRVVRTIRTRDYGQIVI